MSIARRTQFALWLVVVLAIGLALIEFGIYGWLLFVIVPFALGLFAAGIARPATVQRAAAVGAGTILVGCLLLLAFAFEGVICIVMALPVVLLLGCLGALTGFWLQQSNLKPQSGAAMLILPIAAFTWDVKAPTPLFPVTTQVVVRATPEQVWKHVISYDVLSTLNWFSRLVRRRNCFASVWTGLVMQPPPERNLENLRRPTCFSGFGK